MSADSQAMLEEEPHDTDDLDRVSARPRGVAQQRLSFRTSARLCRRARQEALRRGFSSLTAWLRTMMWQLVSEVKEE
jgi:hypothetical protein